MFYEEKTQHTPTSLGSASSASPAPVSPAAAAVVFGVKDGEDLGDCRTAGTYWGLENASHRHTIICVPDKTCARLTQNIHEMTRKYNCIVIIKGHKPWRLQTMTMTATTMMTKHWTWWNLSNDVNWVQRYWIICTFGGKLRSWSSK